MHRELIEHPEAWPVYPKLPMKRRRRVGMPGLGYLLAGDVSDGKVIVHKGLIYSEATETVEFESIDALLEAGWVVD